MREEHAEQVKTSDITTASCLEAVLRRVPNEAQPFFMGDE